MLIKKQQPSNIASKKTIKSVDKIGPTEKQVNTEKIVKQDPPEP